MKLAPQTIANMQNTSLQGKWALVTGASRGIGQQIALGLAQHHCNLVLHARDKKHLESTLEKLKEYPIETFLVTGDLGISRDLENIIQTIAEAKLAVDILYNNAAIMDAYKPVFTKTASEWQQVFQVNLFAVVRLCSAFIPPMLERNWGRVVNVSSGIKDTPQLAPYSVSKAAIDKYTQDLAAELRGTNVLVNYLDPGWLKTDLGGQQAPNEVASVLPGALYPVLLPDNSICGKLFCAQDYN